MNGRWCMYRGILFKLRQHGMPEDRAADAARELVNMLRVQRDQQIRAARRAGRSIRELARAWGMSTSTVHDVVFGDSPESERRNPPT